MSAGKHAGGVDLPICIWLEFVDEADQEPPDPASSITGVFVAASIEDQCSPDLAAGLLECELEELLVEVCYRLGTESAQERARTDEPHGWVSMYEVPMNRGWAAYCSIAIVACNWACGGHNSFGSAGDGWTNGLKIGVKATLNYGHFDVIFDVLR